MLCDPLRAGIGGGIIFYSLNLDASPSLHPHPLEWAMPERSSYEDRADCADSQKHLSPCHLSACSCHLKILKQQPLHTGVFPFCFSLWSGSLVCNLTRPKSNPHRVLPPKPLQQLGFSWGSLGLCPMPTLASSPLPPH